MGMLVLVLATSSLLLIRLVEAALPARVSHAGAG